MLSIRIYCFGLLLIYISGKTVKLPKDLPRCYRNDPNLSQCLLEATDKIRPALRAGIPELRIPPLEPFNLPRIELQQGSQALNFKATLNDVTIRGLTNYKFSRFDFDVENLQFICEVHFDSIELVGNYNITGRILIAPVVGNGKFVANIDSADAVVYQKYTIGDLKGDKHIIPTFTNNSINVSGPKAHLDGLFDGNKELNDVTNKAISDNVNELFEDLKPVVEETITRIIGDLLLTHFTENIPFDQLYPVKP